MATGEDQGHFLVQYKYAEYGTVINPCTTESGYWQNPVDYILTTNTSLLLYEKSSAATVLSHVKYLISSLNSGKVLLIYVAFTVDTLKCETFIFEKSIQK